MAITLEQIFGTIAIELAHDGVEFRLVPFTNAESIAWNRTLFDAEREGESKLEQSERVQREQLELMAAHMRDCVREGSSRKVTADWLGKHFPQNVLQDLASFFSNSDRPAWAGETGN